VARIGHATHLIHEARCFVAFAATVLLKVIVCVLSKRRHHNSRQACEFRMMENSQTRVRTGTTRPSRPKRCLSVEAKTLQKPQVAQEGNIELAQRLRRLPNHFVHGIGSVGVRSVYAVAHDSAHLRLATCDLVVRLCR
jgi:hypothetical protein